MEDQKMNAGPESNENSGHKPASKGDMSRRNFLKNMAGALGAVAMGKLVTGCGPGGVGREAPEGCVPVPSYGIIKTPEGCKPEPCRP